jgi:uncharacterized membrane protein YqhA
MFKRILAGSRYFVILAVVGSFVSSVAVLIYGVFIVASTILHTFTQPRLSEEGARELSVGMIGTIDLFLLGTVLYIIALGLYELFIDDTLIMPKWLKIDTLDELKEKLIGVIVVLLLVSFLAQVALWEGNTNIIAYGGAIALVLLALAALTWNRGRHANGSTPSQPAAEKIKEGSS